MGGGTYARKFKSAVSFGAETHGLVLPEWAVSCMGPMRAPSEAQLKQALKIYILAIFRLMELDL